MAKWKTVERPLAPRARVKVDPDLLEAIRTTATQPHLAVEVPLDGRSKDAALAQLRKYLPDLRVRSATQSDTSILVWCDPAEA